MIPLKDNTIAAQSCKSKFVYWIDPLIGQPQLKNMFRVKESCLDRVEPGQTQIPLPKFLDKNRIKKNKKFKTYMLTKDEVEKKLCIDLDRHLGRKEQKHTIIHTMEYMKSKGPFIYTPLTGCLEIREH